MKAEEFQKLLTEYTQNTKKVRACSKDWYSGVCKIPDEISNKIGCIVRFLQDKIDHGQFCKQDEYLMIYNFQPLYTSNDVYLCSLNMVVRPINKINDLETVDGTPLHLVIDGKNGKVVNDSYASMEMGLYDEEEDEEEEEPKCYGNYLDYPTPTTPDFKARLTALEPVRLMSVDSNGKNSEMKTKSEFQNVQKVVAFRFNLKLTEPFAPVSFAALTPTSQAIFDQSLSSSVSSPRDKMLSPIKGVV